MNNNKYTITYRFDFEDDRQNFFNIDIDSSTMLNVTPQPEDKPYWTKLGHKKCACCSLNDDKDNYCPIALNIVGLIEAFKGLMSSEKCSVYCITPERTYFKEASVQEGLFSIFGIVNATSKCPVMNFFKPMARFHLPFSTVQETKVRVISFYLLSQYFKQKKSATIDIELEKLDKHY